MDDYRPWVFSPPTLPLLAPPQPLRVKPRPLAQPGMSCGQTRILGEQREKLCNSLCRAARGSRDLGLETRPAPAAASGRGSPSGLACGRSGETAFGLRLFEK